LRTTSHIDVGIAGVGIAGVGIALSFMICPNNGSLG
jgi:hypothetical protein